MADYLQSVRHALSEMAAEGATTVGTYADRRLTEILCVDSASRILREILNDDQVLAETAARSYTHTNGFDKFTLLSSTEPEFKLRLHAFWPNGNNPQKAEFIHNHRWFFRSTILYGRVNVETFTERNGGDPMYRHEYRPRDDAKEIYGLTVVGLSNLASDLMYTLAPGSTYTMSPDLLHRVIRAGDAPAITMFVRWASTQPTASVFADLPIRDEGILSVPSFARDHLQLRLQDVIDILDQARGSGIA